MYISPGFEPPSTAPITFLPCEDCTQTNPVIRKIVKKIRFYLSAAASGWAGWALAHPEYGSSVNPITTRGADYAHHITASPTGFENPAASLGL